MRIDYNILWFENDEGWLKPTVKGISNMLEDYGFRLRETSQKDGSKIDDLIVAIQSKALDVDMIFMDFKLSGKVNGEKLIETIRKKNLYTEILFYSNDVNVKQIIEDAYGSIEGIYYAGRDNFRQKAQEVIWHTIKKVEDVESMRGLIMGATSEIENVMKEITLEYIEGCGDNIKNIIATPIFKEVEKNVNEKSKKYTDYVKSLNLKNLVKEKAMFDADKKAFAIQRIIDNLKHPELKEYENDMFYNSISPLFTTRNKFGHCKVIINDKGIRVLQSAEPIEEFTDENCIEIRKKLITYLELIHKIKSLLPKK